MRKKTPIETTAELAELVRKCVPRPRRQAGKKTPIDPATRTFQALRIAVNDELRALENLLDVLPSCLKPGGRAVLISFHSLEDRLVKQAFADDDLRTHVWLTPANSINLGRLLPQVFYYFVLARLGNGGPVVSVPSGNFGNLTAGLIAKRIGLPVRKLSRTGSSMGLSAKSCAWQFMQVFVGGMPAKADSSTEEWQ